MSSQTRWLLPVVMAAALLAVSGGLAAQQLYRMARDPVAVAPSGADDAADADGNAKVRVSADTFAHPDGQEVRDLVQRYVTSRNRQDYAMWRDTVTTREARSMSVQQWLAAVGGIQTHDVVIRRVESAPGPHGRVLVTFRVTQPGKDPSAPAVLCHRSRAVFPLATENGKLRLGSPRWNNVVEESC
ncbi:hypothetical protein GCM10012275_35410 [Longimycelium tulufanense]|uniref:Uncharacterized protein n=2 Tax=Longimycelium tulufanense TaxID=907463 RepID=A0A8J3CE65_9PSEU|nr:hypothetical protein GCM10012275_35410 [Longimycelium tulufanense]